MIRPLLAPYAENNLGHIRADSIRVGQILITEEGIWIGGGDHKKPTLALFNTEDQAGIGVYAPGSTGPTEVCLFVDGGGRGCIQFVRKGDRESLTVLSCDEVAKLKGNP